MVLLSGMESGSPRPVEPLGAQGRRDPIEAIERLFVAAERTEDVRQLVVDEERRRVHGARSLEEPERLLERAPLLRSELALLGLQGLRDLAPDRARLPLPAHALEIGREEPRDREGSIERTIR